MKKGIFEESARCLDICEPDVKCSAVAAVWLAYSQGRLRRDSETPVTPIGEPGRPGRPELVKPARVPRRRLGSREGRAALVHAIAHIEFNAINLALDAAFRFRGMPGAYYGEWLSVAADEARHFRLLDERLASLDYGYGDFPAHDGLWEMAIKTGDSCLQRMALVPRVLEARGLDVTPGMIGKLEQAGDAETVDILRLILEEEVRHVEIGTRWFQHCCALDQLDPETTFMNLLSEHFSKGLRGPFNVEARLRAGFSKREMEKIAAGGPGADTN